MDRALLKQSIDEWQLAYRTQRESIIPRAEIDLPTRDVALAFVGVRRSGKTFSTFEASRSLPAEQVLYYNFEDPLFSLSSSVHDVDTLLSVASEFAPAPFDLLILDEIQNVEGWERWLRKMIDQKRYRIIVTGSSAKLLSSELATSITGRSICEVIWPLGYRHYCAFTSREPKSPDQYRAALRAYMTWGGFPEVALTPNETLRKRLLRQYLDDIVLKDVINRHDIRQKRALDQLVTYYLTNLSCLHSYTSIKNAFHLSIDTVSDYTRALTEAFVLFEVSRYHPNLKVQARDPRKVYIVDTGLRTVGARSVQDDIGKLLENIVYIELRRRNREIFYFSQKYETDFIIVDRNTPVDAIQVCASDLSDPKTRDRELRALDESLVALHLPRGTIVTLDREEHLRTPSGKQIAVVPAHQWLLDDHT